MKIGWLWLTLAFVSLLVSQPAYRSSSAGAKQPRRIAQAVLIDLRERGQQAHPMPAFFKRIGIDPVFAVDDAITYHNT